MTITKYGHSCLLIESNGKKLLVDPGAYTFSEQFSPQSIGPVDAILITHEHADHMEVPALKTIMQANRAEIISGQAVRALLEKEQMSVQAIAPGQTLETAGFTIAAFAAKHEPIPTEPPENTAYLINGRLLHPGDSLETAHLPVNPEILALPTQAPWLRAVDAIAYAKQVRPQAAFPIHNGIYKEAIGNRFDGIIGAQLSEAGIDYRQLAVGESWQV